MERKEKKRVWLQCVQPEQQILQWQKKVFLGKKSSSLILHPTATEGKVPQRLFLLFNIKEIQDANCVVAVAGMEGALASVIGGLVDVPVIAVPTSVGYGASFHGLSALLTMINSCANGIATVNIDNGYGAGYLATQINRLAIK